MEAQMHSETHPITTDHLAKLRGVLGSGPVLILTHDNPDPDGLSAGKALATLFKTAWGLPSRLIYGGVVARAENRAMLNRLTPEWEAQESLEALDQYSAIALVDSQPGAGNNMLPEEHIPQVVIDHHHPVREIMDSVSYVDLRTDIGATVTMVFQYLEAAGIEPDPLLATAMFYGLKTDTRGLSRGTSPMDEAAYLKLLARLDRKELIRIEQAGLAREHFQFLDRGLQAARIHGKVVIAPLAQIDQPDLAAEMADLLIRLEGTHAVLCHGIYGNTLHLSLRIRSFVGDAGKMIQRIVVSRGKAGGHGSIAGGQVPLVAGTAEQIVMEIEKRFLGIMGETGNGEPLLAA